MEMFRGVASQAKTYIKVLGNPTKEIPSQKQAVGGECLREQALAE